MTFTAATGVASADRRDARRASALLAWADRNALWITALAAIVVFSLAKLPLHITQDSWLALTGGRYIAAHGIPQHDTLFVVTHGARWLDQQWLAQLATYDLYKVGGVQLYGLLYVALAISGIAICLAASRAFGGSERHMLWVLPIAGALYFAGRSTSGPKGSPCRCSRSCSGYSRARRAEPTIAASTWSCRC